VAVSAVLHCSPQQVVTLERQMLADADSLFSVGNYEYAKIKYAKIRDEFPRSKAAVKAQFKLGYLNVYYENPFANPDAALREFSRFGEMYPDHELIGEVNSWIRILVVLQSFKRQYNAKSFQIDKLKGEIDKKVPQQREGASSIEVLMDAVQRCYVENDSLQAKIRSLDSIITIIDRLK
jgi:outer membrane protein assembly factor BamD (BamD/ComL family)